jgi:2,3-bisphosphoglycerate-dependent phosphoglycerate mutase
MTEIILVRHGETEWNRERRMQGHTNTPLSDIGRAQAAALGLRMKNARIDVLYSSDLSRAWDTAAAVSAHTGHDVRKEPLLRERTFGIFEGLTYDEMAMRYPEAHALFLSRDPEYAMPGGESAREFYDRSLGCLTEIACRHDGDTVMVVTHGLVLDTLYRAATGMPIQLRREAPLLNASLNTFRHEAQTWTMISWGDVEHLAEVGVTRFDVRSL